MPWLLAGMATGRVRVGFFHTQTRPAGMDLRPEPGPISKRISFVGPKSAPRALRARWAMVLQGPFCGLKKKILPDTDFLSNQTSRGKRTQENPDLNRSETNKNHYFLSNQQIRTRIIKIALKLENTNLITIENTTDRNKNHYFSLQHFPTSKVKTRINI